ncbi:MAG: SurA N-terminal domain-containing protein [Chitinophagales bacterium]|jgi:peptidyl-prolyl cis-trans isomerase D|nr:SurA N-terminal domain-containing protein [Chitinophagales bacterium]
MAIISTIQRFSFLLVTLISIALILFLVELVLPNMNILSYDDDVLAVNGQNLNMDDFNKTFNKKVQEIKEYNPQLNLTPEMEDMIRKQIWDEFLQKNTLIKEIENLGIKVSDEELKELTIGKFVSEDIRQIPDFQTNGAFDPNKLIQFVKTLDMDNPGTKPGTKRKQWLEFEQNIKNTQKIVKFGNLVSQGMYMPKWFMEYEMKPFKQTANVDVAMIPYSLADKSKIDTSDTKLEAYFEKNKKSFYLPNQTYAKLKLVNIPLKPTSADSVEIFQSVNEKLEALKSSNNDTTYFTKYGSSGFNTTFLRKEQLSSLSKAEELLSASKGSIVGPHIEGNKVLFHKIINKRNISDSVRVKMMSVSFQEALKAQNQELIKQRRKFVDSVFKLVDTLNQNFDQVARFVNQSPDVPELWIYRASNEFPSEVFDGEKKNFQVSSDRDGSMRIIQVVSSPSNIPAIQLGSVSIPYIASPNTEVNINSIANDVLAKMVDINSLSKINSTADQMSFDAFVTKNDNQINGLMGNAREIVKWAFDEENKENKKIFRIAENQVVAYKYGYIDEEHIDLNIVKNEVKSMYIKDETYEVLAQKLKNTKDLSALSSMDSSVRIENHPDMTLMKAYSLNEPVISYAISGLKENTISKPLKGLASVILVKLNSKTITPLDPGQELGMKQDIASKFADSKSIVEAVQKRFKIKDNRVKFF